MNFTTLGYTVFVFDGAETCYQAIERHRVFLLFSSDAMDFRSNPENYLKIKIFETFDWKKKLNLSIIENFSPTISVDVILGGVIIMQWAIVRKIKIDIILL